MQTHLIIIEDGFIPSCPDCPKRQNYSNHEELRPQLRLKSCQVFKRSPHFAQYPSWHTTMIVIEFNKTFSLFFKLN